MKTRIARWLGEDEESHFLSDSTGEKGGFLCSNVLIAHRPGVSDAILYNFFVDRAMHLYNAVVFYPLLEPYVLPNKLRAIELKPEELAAKRFERGKIYRLRGKTFEEDRTLLDDFYTKIASPRKRTRPFVIIIDTLRKLHPILEEHIRRLIHEAPLCWGSVLVHCPLSIIPADLLSVFSNVIVVWPSQHEINLLNTHFPADKIPPLLDADEPKLYNSRMLVFNSKPVEERGWAWKKFSPIEPITRTTLKQHPL